jgi:hypothetical protein
MIIRRVIFVLLLAICGMSDPINIAAAQDRLNGVMLLSGTVSLDGNIIEQLRVLSKDQQLGVLIRLAAPLSPVQRAQLEANGIAFEGRFNETAYLVSLAPTENRLALLNGIVNAGHVLRPAEKIHPRLQEEMAINNEILTSRPNYAGPLNLLTVFFLSSVTDEEAGSRVDSVHARIVKTIMKNTYIVEGTFEQALQLAEFSVVKAIHPGPTPFIQWNDRARVVSKTDNATNFSLNVNVPAYSLSGRGIRIGIVDDPIDDTNFDFHTIQPTGTPGATRVVIGRGTYRPCDKTAPCVHGTHVASIAAGNGFNSKNLGRADYSLRGHAPEAALNSYDAKNFFETMKDIEDVFLPNSGATDVSNHSYPEGKDYSAKSKIIDDAIAVGVANVFARTRRPQVWAAGNLGVLEQNGFTSIGYYSITSHAKNSISVGSIDTISAHTGDTRLSDFSSLGPTWDGRIKPDLVAPGCHDSDYSKPNETKDKILAAWAETLQIPASQTYGGDCGTSQAAPIVTGIIALMMQKQKDGGGDLNDVYPSSYKAILIQTAQDLVKKTPYVNDFQNPDTGRPVLYYEGPDFATGYGLVNAVEAVNTIGHKSTDLRCENDSGLWCQSELTFDPQIPIGASENWCIDIPANPSELKVTIAWDDNPEWNPYQGREQRLLINDLNLHVFETTKPAQKFLPWTLATIKRKDERCEIQFDSEHKRIGCTPDNSCAAPKDCGFREVINESEIIAAKPAVDTENNVEMVQIKPAELNPGQWKATVNFSRFHGTRSPGLPPSQSYSIVSSLPLRKCP